MNLFVFGLGYTALHFVRRERVRFARVVGTMRSPDKAEALKGDGIEARVFAPEEADARIEADLAETDALLVSIPPGERGDPVLARFGDVIARGPRLAWIGYLSTVGVYGDHEGAWVDEATPPVPGSARAQARVAAEDGWLELGRRAAKPVQIFRLAGIYGPGRNALANLAEGRARRVIKPGQVFNRIHVDDIAAVLGASIDHPRAGAIYNVADDEPAPPQDVVAHAALLAGVAPPPEVPFEEAGLSPMGVSFYAENRRIANRRIKDERGARLCCPTCREVLWWLREAGEGP